MSSPSYPAIIIPPQEHHLDNTSYPFNAKIMVVAVATLLVVTSFVLLLHVYAKWWFVTRSRGRRPSLPDLPPPSPSPSPMLSQLLHRRHAVDDDAAQVGDHGLDPRVIARLPTFVCKWDGSGRLKAGLECVVCLSLFEENEKGRMLPKCHHAFHVDCIDMWLMSHSTCPLCRNNVVVGNIEEAALEPQISPSPAMAVDSSMGNEILLDGNISHMLEVVVEDTQASNSKDSSPSSSSSSSSSCTLSESLKRMLSRSRSESRVFPSSDHVTDR